MVDRIDTAAIIAAALERSPDTWAGFANKAMGMLSGGAVSLLAAFSLYLFFQWKGKKKALLEFQEADRRSPTPRRSEDELFCTAHNEGIKLLQKDATERNAELQDTKVRVEQIDGRLEAGFAALRSTVESGFSRTNARIDDVLTLVATGNSRRNSPNPLPPGEEI